jgi:hypothetical protein
METASQFVRTSIAKRLRNVCSVATSRFDSLSITPEMW